ncbi:LSU ribosomal protein L29P [Roseovarius azorensis]|uniref:Large ribosomal subunit protein uL29 n=1 Tax=Roseovarius azorensis TaxID=1287727 RepID=A0A1H7THG5_9RHOB|nr:50S ribosomal protein L29 [Roseovarius azorensis]SEL84261.1 LSU ribosomal protein L29P [Roseovarius azorensis]
MNAKELRDKTPDQLREELTNLKKQQFNLRFRAATGQLENPAQMRTARRDAARVLTILNEKAAGAASGAE